MALTFDIVRYTPSAALADNGTFIFTTPKAGALYAQAGETLGDLGSFLVGQDSLERVAVEVSGHFRCKPSNQGFRRKQPERCRG